MTFYISMKFHKNILNNFRVIEWTRNYHCPIAKENNSKLYRQELCFLCSACRLMMFHIAMKFHETILNGFQVMERTRIYLCRISKGNNSKTILTRVTVLVFYKLSDDVLYFYEVS